MNKLWKKFNKLTAECYNGMAFGKLDLNSWNEAFEALISAIQEERSNNKNFAPEWSNVDDETEYQFDVDGWMEDYLDELGMRKQHEKCIEVCRKVISLFRWKEEDPDVFNVQIASTLAAEGKNKEALEFSEAWYQENMDSIPAATAVIYARLGMKDIAGAEAVVRNYITDDTPCTEENDILFIAAQTLYQVSGNKKENKKITKKLDQYEKELEAEFMDMGDEELDFEIDDEDLPF